MNTLPGNPTDADKVPPDPYVEILFRWGDGREKEEVIYLQPVDGDLLREELLREEAPPAPGPGPSDTPLDLRRDTQA
jgi:hypothetical protein